MTKIFLSLVFLLFFVTISFADFVQYRTSSGRVSEISLLPIASQAYFTVVENPTFIDGKQWLDDNYNTGVLGYSKIYDNGVVRNATQAEIDTFGPLARDDYNQIEANKAIKYFQNNPQFRRIMIALIKGIIKEDNEDRLWIRDFKAAVAASTSLADFQSRVAALDTPTDREFHDAKDYIIGQVSKDD